MDKVNFENRPEARNIQVSEAEDVTISVKRREIPEEIASRLKVEEAKAAHERLKDLILTITGILILSVIAGLCVWVVIQKDSAAEDKRLAFAILAAIVAGFIGFIAGRATKEKS